MGRPPDVCGTGNSYGRQQPGTPGRTPRTRRIPMQTLWNKTDITPRNRSRLLPFAMVLALTLFGFGASSASAAQKSVPFGSFTSGTVTGTAPTFALAGRGVSANLGKTTETGTVAVTDVA